jgi:hypothetical protein
MLAQVLPQMPSVGDLHRVRSPGPGAFGIAAGTVPADHPHSGMRGQPALQRLRPAIGKHLDRPVGVDVDQHGRVAVAPAEREVINAENPHLTAIGIWQRADQAQHAAAAGRKTHQHGQSGARTPGKGENDHLE